VERVGESAAIPASRYLYPQRHFVFTREQPPPRRRLEVSDGSPRNCADLSRYTAKRKPLDSPARHTRHKPASKEKRPAGLSAQGGSTSLQKCQPPGIRTQGPRLKAEHTPRLKTTHHEITHILRLNFPLIYGSTGGVLGWVQGQNTDIFMLDGFQ
jgi:hypothetical protein